MHSDIHALNTFDPANYNYLEVVEINGQETLRVVHKNIFQRFVMWLGRIFSFCHNPNTSMKKIAEYVARNVKRIGVDAQLDPQSLKKLYVKLREFRWNHYRCSGYSHPFKMRDCDFNKIREVAKRTMA